MFDFISPYNVFSQLLLLLQTKKDLSVRSFMDESAFPSRFFPMLPSQTRNRLHQAERLSKSLI